MDKKLEELKRSLRRRMNEQKALDDYLMRKYGEIDVEKWALLLPGWLARAEIAEKEIDALNAKVAALEVDNERLGEALKVMLEGKVDYMLRNNLGNPYREESTQLAVKALAQNGD